MSDNPDIIVSDLIIKDKERYTRLVSKFIKLLPAFIEEFEEPLGVKDYDTLKSIAHRLKGAGGNFGYMQITETCREMEAAIKEDAFEQVNVLYQQLLDIRDKILLGWEQA